jgi:hypothetical protein
MSSPKDKLKFELNPITGELDLVKEFNPDRIITHENNQLGNRLVTYDMTTGLYVDMDAVIVTDNNGNVVVN